MKKRATTTSAIEWNTMLGLCSRLKEDKHFRDYLLIFCGSFWGLRISDLLSIRFCDVVNKSEMILVEKKTGKTRIITINPKVATAINLCIKQLQLKNKYREDGYMFANRWGGKLSISYINRRLKIIFRSYNVNVQNGSSHTLRKTFGRELWNLHGQSDSALTHLSLLFNHSNLALTRTYLSITKDNIADMYLKL